MVHMYSRYVHSTPYKTFRFFVAADIDTTSVWNPLDPERNPG